MTTYVHENKTDFGMFISCMISLLPKDSLFIMSSPFRVGKHIVFARVVCPSVCPSICLSQNRVRSVIQNPFEIFS